jgi:VanZ family protein
MKQTVAIRILLGILIFINLLMIFSFSGESGNESGQTSKSVTGWLARITVRDFGDKSLAEQDAIIAKMHPIVRKLAHMAEFGLLCGLSILFLQTWNLPYWKSSLFALLFTGVVASLDELYQYAQKAGRAGQISDVFIDLLGALFVSLLLFSIVHIKKLMSRRIQKTR